MGYSLVKFYHKIIFIKITEKLLSKMLYSWGIIYRSFHNMYTYIFIKKRNEMIRCTIICPSYNNSWLTHIAIWLHIYIRINKQLFTKYIPWLISSFIVETDIRPYQLFTGDTLQSLQSGKITLFKTRRQKNLISSLPIYLCIYASKSTVKTTIQNKSI